MKWFKKGLAAVLMSTAALLARIATKKKEPAAPRELRRDPPAPPIRFRTHKRNKIVISREARRNGKRRFPNRQTCVSSASGMV